MPDETQGNISLPGCIMLGVAGLQEFGAIIRLFGILVAVMGAALACTAALAQERLPTAPGTCVLTRISSIGTRLEESTGQPIPGSDSAVTFANKGYQVSYSEEPAISHSRRGDPVYMC
jgi:hypothetical protein